MIWLFKLGGSVITHKKHRTSLNTEAIERIIREILDSMIPSTDTIILVLGAGSFGHVPLHEFMTQLTSNHRLSTGTSIGDSFESATEEIHDTKQLQLTPEMNHRSVLDRLYGRFLSAMKTLKEQTIRILRRTVKKVRAGEQMGIAYICERPILRRIYQRVKDQEMVISRMKEKLLEHLRKQRRLIILRGFAHRVHTTHEPLVLKISSDEWVLYVAEMLQKEGLGPLQIIFVGDVDGLYDQDPKTHPDARRLDLSEVRIDELERQRTDYLKSCAHDCTGGIFLKARILKQLEAYGTPHLVDGTKREGLRSMINQLCEDKADSPLTVGSVGPPTVEIDRCL